MALDCVRQVFLAGMAAVYLAAFVSLFLQLPALYGSKGILPARGLLSRVEEEADSTDTWTLMKAHPTLLWLYRDLGITLDLAMDAVAFVGIVFSFLATITWRFRTKAVFALLWVCYYSLYQVGQTFLHFQWDILLLEAGCLALIASPLLTLVTTSEHGNMHAWTDDDPAIPVFGIRWLIFRLMFLSGIVKLQSNCPTWWGLTAMDIHYESQCIPGPLAWYAHHLPHWFQALSVVLVFAIEGFLPFFFFFPIRPLQVIASLAQVALMILIMLTGNYNFFNILTIILCVAVVDDHVLSYFVPKSFLRFHTPSVNSRQRSSWIQVLLTLTALVGVAFVTVKYFGLKLVLDGANTQVTSQIMFTKAEFNKFVTYSMTAGIVLGACDFVLTAITAMISTLKRRRFTQFLNIFPQLLAVGALFAASLVSMSWNDRHGFMLSASPHWKHAEDVNAILGPYEVVNSYGLFRSMTGVGGRPEVVIEGSYTGEEGSWKEFEFRYKPTSVDRMPPVLIPHQPRLDWQMWFAALDRIERNLWLQHFAIMLLQGDKAAYDLIEPQQPFPREKPATHLRMLLYHYHYTPSGTNTSAWWTREVQREYMYPITLPPLRDLVNNMKQRLGYDQETSEEEAEAACNASPLCAFMRFARESINSVCYYEIATPIIFVLLTLLAWASPTQVSAQAQHSKVKLT